MRQFERYTINFAQRTDPGGTHEKPKLLQITSGERSEESVIYHMKIGQLYQQMHINKVKLMVQLIWTVFHFTVRQLQR